MKVKVLALVSAWVLGAAGGPVFSGENHELQAFMHTEAAVTHGEMGHADILVQHALAALEHAHAADPKEQSDHMQEGITHLSAAIEHGKMGHTDIATEHAKQAFEHIKQAGR